MNMHNAEGFNKILDDKRFEIIRPYFKGRIVLEIGPGNGHMTKKLNDYFTDIYTLDLDTNLEGIGKVDTVICTNVIEHIEPNRCDEFFYLIKSFCDDNTTFIFSVPNALSYNRLLGTELKLIEHPHKLDKQDIAVGHKNTFDADYFRYFLNYNGFSIDTFFTQIYKPFHNELMMKLPDEIKSYCLNKILDKNGAEIFAICGLKK